MASLVGFLGKTKMGGYFAKLSVLIGFGALVVPLPCFVKD
jgi:hypothetical protein